MTQVMDSDDVIAQSHVTANRSATKAHLDKAFAQTHHVVQEAAAGNPSATPEQLAACLCRNESWPPFIMGTLAVAP